MRKRHLLVANWKMNCGPAQARAYARELRSHATTLTRTDVWVAPPIISLDSVAQELSGSAFAFGSQNVHWSASGAFTGETSPSFITELGGTFGIVGHSERRHLFGESSELVAKRASGALSAGLATILCVGETESDRSAGKTEAVLRAQLSPALQVVSPEQANRLIIAYEPVWAIGTGKVATLAEIDHAHRFIASVWGEHGLLETPATLYGGSVNPGNFAEILTLAAVDGALVGGASLKLDQWQQLIVKSVSTDFLNTFRRR